MIEAKRLYFADILAGVKKQQKCQSKCRQRAQIFDTSSRHDILYPAAYVAVDERCVVGNLEFAPTASRGRQDDDFAGELTKRRPSCGSRGALQIPRLALPRHAGAGGMTISFKT